MCDNKGMKDLILKIKENELLKRIINKITHPKQWNKKIVAVWVAFIVLILILRFAFGVRICFISGNSMYPTYKNHSVCLSFGLGYEAKQGDCICIKNDGKLICKRVIATEGQKVYVDYAHNKVYVDDKEIDSSYINEPMKNMGAYFDTPNPVTVPEDRVFVMGDNRNYSTDSRNSLVGMVENGDVVGKIYPAR